jgi:hypothetical protein
MTQTGSKFTPAGWVVRKPTRPDAGNDAQKLQIVPDTVVYLLKEHVLFALGRIEREQRVTENLYECRPAERDDDEEHQPDRGLNILDPEAVFQRQKEIGR